MKLSFAVVLSLCGALPSFGGDGSADFLLFFTQPSAETTPSPDAAPPMPQAPATVQRPAPLSTVPAPLMRHNSSGHSSGRSQLPYTPSYDGPDSPYVPMAGPPSPTRPSILSPKRQKSDASPVSSPTAGSSPVLPPPPQRPLLRAVSAASASKTPEIPLGQLSPEDDVGYEGGPLERSYRVSDAHDPKSTFHEVLQKFISVADLKKFQEATDALNAIMGAPPTKNKPHPLTMDQVGRHDTI